MTLATSLPKKRKIVYPVSDGKPMAETDKHADLMVYSKEALRARYDHEPNVYVSGNNFLFYEEGNPAARISPDTYVVFGVPKGRCDSYKVWEEGGRLPSIVFEFTSKKTREEDVYKKRPLYERLGIREYVQFDPTGDYLAPILQGFSFVNGVYVPMPLVNNRLHSQVLGLDIVWTEGDWMRFYDPVTQEWLLSPLEAARLVKVEAQRAATEMQRAEAAEAENARLRAALEAALRGQRLEE
jgi:Uma2 family endonuclease